MGVCGVDEVMACGKPTFEHDGEEIEFEITEWTGTIESPPAEDLSWMLLVGSVTTLLLAPVGHPELN